MKKKCLSITLVFVLLLSCLPTFATSTSQESPINFNEYTFNLETIKDEKSLYEVKDSIESAFYFGMGFLAGQMQVADPYPMLSNDDLIHLKSLYHDLENKAESIAWEDPMNKEIFMYNLQTKRLEIDLSPIAFQESVIYYPYMLYMDLSAESLKSNDYLEHLDTSLTQYQNYLSRIFKHLKTETEKDGYLPYFLTVNGFVTLSDYSERLDEFHIELEGAIKTLKTTSADNTDVLTRLGKKVSGILEQSKAIKNTIDLSKAYRIKNNQTRLDKKSYEALAIPLFTGTTHSAEAISKMGESEVKRIQNELTGHLTKLGYKGSLSAQIKAFQKDSKIFEGDEAIAHFTEIMTTLRGKLHKFFYVEDYPHYMPIIVPKEGYSAYSSYTFDGKSTGQFMPSKGEHPDYTMETLVVHETVFGHHLELQRRLLFPKDIPYRQSLSVLSYSEGWALYMEKLAREEGLILTERGYVGSLLGELLRAGRLVADVGINYYNWSDEKATEYLETQTFNERALEEVERYNKMPGQALTYKIGELEFVAVRDVLKKTLGSDFSYLDFHDQILEYGNIPPKLFLKAVEKLMVH